MFFKSFGQDAKVDRSLKTELIKTINKQKTGSVQDVLTNLYRSGIDNLLGKEHKFSFSSSFYGIDSIFQGKKAIKI